MKSFQVIEINSQIILTYTEKITLRAMGRKFEGKLFLLTL